MEVYNWHTSTFESVSVPMPDGGRAQHAAALLGDGTVLLAGGTADPAVVGGGLIAAADVFELGARNDSSGTWDGTFLPVNGDMQFPRRLADTVTINNGRVFLIGGLTATGGALAQSEIYTPRGGLNLRPSARTDLSSSQQSWAYGAPLVYRLTDPELDDVRVVVQWSNNGGRMWHAAASQAVTIGGDVAEAPAPLTSGDFDVETQAIAPRIFPQSDHTYIWAMTQDIPRPPEGGSTGPYIFRTIPFGAVQGSSAQSVPVTVLYNTKVIPTILPLASSTGVPGAEQGGDIEIWVHLRDIDGTGSPSNGDAAEAYFDYAIDANGDGIINDGQEFWNPMSATGAAKYEAQRGNNLQTGLMTYSESYLASEPEFGARPADKGWTVFEWDSVYDLGAPASSRADVFVRVRPYDNLGGVTPDEGFSAFLFNETNQPESIRLVRDPEGLWLDQFVPSGGNRFSVAVNEPLEFHFNGLVDPASVNEETIQIRLFGSQVLGVFTTEQDEQAFTSLVTFYPRTNSTDQDELVFSEQDNPTVLFPFNEYSVFIPGYAAHESLPMTTATVLPDLSGFATEPDETSHLVQNVEIDTSFTTNAGNYDNGEPNQLELITPVGGSSLAPDAAGITLSYSSGVDLTTVRWPNITLTVNNAGGPTAATAAAPVIPFQTSITNVQDPVTGHITSTVEIVPLTHLPSGRTITVQTDSGMLGANGRPVAATETAFTVVSYGTKSVAYNEDFSSQTFEDSSIANPAAWGTDPCAPGALTGLQGGGTPPQGGADLYVPDGAVVNITNAVSDYGNITVEKGGILRIRATSAVTIRATGDVSIAGTVDFKGENGWTATQGNVSSSTYQYTSPRSPGNHLGGTGYNQGGSGGKSQQTSAVRTAGSNGSGPEYGGGGLVAGNTTYYYYGAGGGAGAGHGAAGLPGGMAAAYSSSWTAMGNISVPGGTTGDPDMIVGPSAGSGGGGGGSSTYSTGWYHGGGGGGAGAGAVSIVCDGTFDLKPSGYMDGRGGDGGSTTHYGGSGGGGSGGGLKVTAGVAAKLDGVVDLRGGHGGPRATAYFSDYYARYQLVYGTMRFGGDGGPGRFVAAAPNFVSADDVRVKGQLMVQKVASIPTTSLAAVAPPSAFLNGGTVDVGTATAVHYSSLTVGSGKTVDLVGSNALTIFADVINVQGTLRINGKEPTWGFSTVNTGGVSGYAPTMDYYLGSSPPTQYVGAPGVLGGGKGGNGYSSGTATAANIYNAAGTDGVGPNKGKNKYLTSGGWQNGTYFYYGGDPGGGGGGNATGGASGWAPYVIPGYYNYVGLAAGTTSGRSPSAVEADVANGGGTGDPSTISVTNLSSFVGSGGGGGNAGKYIYSPCNWNYFGMAASAGSGGGALALVGDDTLTVSGTIESKGGGGNVSGAAYASYGYNHSGGGAGSGGTVLLIGDTVEIAPVTNINSATSGATFDLNGGIGGGWRQQYKNSSTISRYPTYNSQGNFGGDGGFGRLVVQYKTSLNGGATLFNRGGMEHVGFDDIYRRYTVLAGSARSTCLGGSNGGSYRSKWYDLGSVSPVVSNLFAGKVGSNTNFTLQGEGAQSHPHNPGPGGTGEPDPTRTSGMQSVSSNFLNGWRFFRFGGVISRASTDPTKPAPAIDNVQFPHVTDDVD
jgi:hypothetical protein